MNPTAPWLNELVTDMSSPSRSADAETNVDTIDFFCVNFAQIRSTALRPSTNHYTRQHPKQNIVQAKLTKIVSHKVYKQWQALACGLRGAM